MKSIIQSIIIILLVFSVSLTNAQIAINSDGSSADASAMLDVTSSNKGILIPRMTTTERTAISSPATGLLVYDTDFNSFWYYANSAWNNISNAIFADSDLDTKIQVEESSDEDIIRFDLGGTEFFKFNNGRIEILNTGNSVFLGEGAGDNDDLSDNDNTFLGYRAGFFNETGVYNSFLGNQAGLFNTGSYNTFLGTKTGFLNTSGEKNLFMGYQSGYSNQSGSNNIFLGYQSGYSETGDNKLYIANSNTSTPLIFGDFSNDSLQINGTLNINGNYAFPITDGTSSQFLTTDGAGTVSWSSLNTLADIDNDTKIEVEQNSDEDIIRFDLGGTEFMQLNSGKINVLNTGHSIFLGNQAGLNDDFSDNLNVFIGDSTGYSNTDGYWNAFLGASAGYSNTEGAGNNFIGYLSGYSNTEGDANNFIGYLSGYSNTTGQGNNFIGAYTGYANTTGQGNNFIGIQSGYANTTGEYNSFIGYLSGLSNTTGQFNNFIGATAGINNDTGDNNTYIGHAAGAQNQTGSGNIFLGYQAGYSETESDKLYIENSNSSSPLIYGDFDADSLQINGKLNINGAFNFPTVDGDTLQFLTTDGAGAVSWSTLNLLMDNDSDTKIEVEQNSDEDIIRFDLGGTEFMQLNSGKINVLNTGHSIFLGNQAGLNDDFSDNFNVFIGDSTGYSNTTGQYNVFMGASAGYSNTTGVFNNFVGYKSGYSNTTGILNNFLGTYSGYSNTTGQYNAFMGVNAGFNNTTGSYNTFMGINTGYSNTTGDYNNFVGVAAGGYNTTGDENNFIGTHAGAANTTGNENNFIGFRAGFNNETGSGNIFLGYKAGYNETESDKLYIENSNSSSPLIYGDFDVDSVQINGKLNINGAFNFPTVDGSASQTLITDGNGTLSWSDIDNTLLSDADADTKIQVEESSNDNIIRFDLAGTEFMRLDSGRMEIVNTGNSIFIGEDAGINDDYSDNRNVFIGYQAGYTNTSGKWNIFTGYRAGYNTSTGNRNIFTGFNAGFENTTGYNNIFTGYNTGYSNTTGYNNIFTGYAAGRNNTTGFANIFLGYEAGNDNDDGNYNVYIGHQAGSSNVSGIKNVYIGYEAGANALDSNKLYIDNSNVDEPLIYGDFENDILEFNGSLGIGTTPTNGKLEVLGNGSNLASYTFGYLNGSGNTGTYTAAPVYSIYTDNKIAAESFHAHSDERIKNIQGISNSKNDLNTLMNIEITNYTLKDTVSKGNQITKKVIAQQVKSVYPNAVSTNTIQVIPNIYKTATIDENGWVSFNEQLQIGDKVQIIFKDKKELLEVLETKENAFRVKPSTINRQPSTVFIYGKQVDDFHTVDYEAISMLNVSATQQLAKENEQLKKRITALEKLEQEVKQLKAQVTKINELEAMLQQLQAQTSNNQ